MPARPLVLYPDPRLAVPAAAVEAFGPDLAALARDVQDTRSAVSAIGLTAPHIGVLLRVVVTRMPHDGVERVYVNPIVLRASPATAIHEEGSVSMPGVHERVARPAFIRVGFRDLAGLEWESDAEGFEAAVLQHEIDQLDGIFWTSRLSRLKRDRLVRRYEKLNVS